MDSECAEFLDRLFTMYENAIGAVERCKVDWAPVAPPITILFGTIGAQMAADLRLDLESVRRNVFELIESSYYSPRPLLADAVFTGLLESMVNNLSNDLDIRRVVVDRLGPRSRAHVDAWIAPC